MDDEDSKLRVVVEHYRLLAAEAQDAASNASIGKYRRAYDTMARHWIELAREIEQSLDVPQHVLH